MGTPLQDLDRRTSSTANSDLVGSGSRKDVSCFQETIQVEEIEETPSQTPPPQVRVYYLDWLRIIAIYLVVMYHCVQSLDWIHLWKKVHLLNVEVYKCFSLMVGMPLFFYISGRAQALARPMRLSVTVQRRFIRLGVPFVIAYVMLIPFWQYVNLREEPDNDGVLPPQNFVLWPVWFLQPKNFIFDTGWLWFLPVLFLVTNINAPLFLWGEKRQTKYAVITTLTWVFTALILLLLGFTLAMCICLVIAPFTAAILLYFVPFPTTGDKSWALDRYLAKGLLTFVQVSVHIGIVCNFRYSELGAGLKPLPALLLFCGHYQQGYFEERWETHDNSLPTETEEPLEQQELEMSQVELSAMPHTAAVRAVVSEPRASTLAKRFATRMRSMRRLFNVAFGGLLIFVLAVGAPLGEWEEELFPLYSASFTPARASEPDMFFGAAHVTATWAYIGLTVPWFAAYTDSEMNPFVYKHASGSAIIVYIFHFIFIKPFAYWVCRDGGLTGRNWWKLLDPFILFTVALSGSFLIYALLLKHPNLGRFFGL